MSPKFLLFTLAALTVSPLHGQSSNVAAAAPASGPPVQVHVDLTKTEGPFNPIYSWFGYDEANYTTMPYGRQLLGELQQLSPVPVYIRVHHLLTSGNGVAELKFSSTNVYSEKPDGSPVYDFKVLDGIFDTYKAEGVRPMVELGFMPKDLAATLPGPAIPYQVHYPQNVVKGASNNPPKDYAKWGELVRVVTAHLVERYGRDEVLKWYFEVWNEPDIGYWHGTPQDYWKLYDYAVAGVRAALPGAKVGGPASTSPAQPKAYVFLKGFLDHVTQGRSAANGGPIPLDFISFHAKGAPKIEDAKVTMGISRELSDADQGFSLISSYPSLPNLPIILSEADPEGCAACSAKLHPANNYRNGTLYPSYTAVAFKALLDLQRSHAVNLISMLSWSFEFENSDFFEGYRSLATNGIDLPILNLFRMLGMMGGSRVSSTSSSAVPLQTLVHEGVRAASDIDALATTSAQQATVLLWNYNDVEHKAAEAPVEVTVAGIPANVHRVLIEQFRIDDTHSNAYSAWLAMSSPQHPTPEQYQQLKAAGQLQMLSSPIWQTVENGTVRLESNLPGQAVALYRVTWQPLLVPAGSSTSFADRPGR